jgi:hypothetical protein
MRVQYDNKLMSSFMLFLDNQIQTRGLAYTNYSGQFFPVTSPIQGYSAYAAPFKQLCNDTSISGANVMTGVYLNGNFCNIGQSGLTAINHNEGAVYFSGQLPTNTVVSGRYAIKEIGMEITDEPESKLLFQTKYVQKSKFNQVLSGLPLDTKTIPIIFLKAQDTAAPHAAFGGVRDNKMTIRAVILAENEFQRVAACNIMKNLTFSGFPVISSLPFDYLGNFTGVNYNYTNVSVDTQGSPLITEVKVNRLSYQLEDDYRYLGKSSAMVDFSISTFMR